MSNDGGRSLHGCGLEAYLEEPGLTEGQRRRLGLFHAVEGGICTRIERLCTEEAIEVTDVAVLVVAPDVHALFFTNDALTNDALTDGALADGAPGQPTGGGDVARTSVILGHRDKLHAFLHTMLPPSDDAPFDPYADLLDPAPSRCVRVLIVDHDSLTVMSYGTFVTVSMDAARMPMA